jgi:HD-GYP domain-containing protein (c-di-GMP phosphodiesterase class II)
MPFTFSTSLLVAVFSLALFLSALNFSIWRIQREDMTPFWLSIWLLASAVLALCRLFQYAALDDSTYRAIPRVLLTDSYLLAYLGYEFANAFIGCRPSKRERAFFWLAAGVPILLLWDSNLILSGEIIIRSTLLGGPFHGVSVGPIYLPVSLWILVIGSVPAIRLLRSPRSHGGENWLIAAGFLLIVAFSLNDFIATGLNKEWIRLSDFNYLPVALFFSYIQVQRFGRMFRHMDVMVHERTATLEHNAEEMAVLAIENSRLFQSEQRRAQETAAIAEVSQDISASLQLDIVLEKIAQHAKNLLQAETSAVYLADPARGILRPIAAIGPDSDEIKQDQLVFDRGILGYIATHKHGEIVNFTDQDPRTHIIQGTEKVANEHLLGVPVISKDQLTGLIAVWRIGQDHTFKPKDLDFLENLAGQVAVAIENARLFEYAQHRLEELEVLQSIASALRQAQTLHDALPIIFDQLIKLLHVDSASLELIDPVNQEIVTELACGQWAPVTGFRTPLDVGVSGRVIRTCQPYITTNAITDGYLVRPDLIGDLTVVACVPVVAQRQAIGALWVGRLNLTQFTQEEVNSLMALGEMVGNTIQRMKLHEQTERQAEEITSAYDLTLEGWAKALELRDKETEGHSRRVTELTIQLSREFNIPESELVHIRRGALLHDIGKMGVPDGVLIKAGPLNDEEWVEMKKHPRYAYDLISPITYLQPALDIPCCHHEHWDGSGYPSGLSGCQIPLAARIFSIVDVYDALTSDRPYRRAWSRQAAIQYLRDQSGIQFDPAVVAAFLQLLENSDKDQ